MNAEGGATRAAIIQTVVKPVFGKRRGTAESPYYLTSDPAASLWGTASVHFRLIAKLVERRHGDIQIRTSSEWLRKNLLHKLKEAWIPRRIKMWKPGVRTRADGTSTTIPTFSPTDDTIGYTTFEDIPPSGVMLAKWRIGMQHPWALSYTEWIAIASEASRMAAVASKKCKSQKRRALVSWAANCLENHARAAHSYCKGDTYATTTYDAAYTCTEGDGLPYHTPDEAVKIRSASWHKLWARDSKEAEQLKETFRTIRLRWIRAGYVPPSWDTDDVRRAIRGLGTDKCPGADGWTGRELRMLPDASIHEPTNLLNDIETTMAWPSQVLQVLVVLIPKKIGDRPISLISLLFKLWESLNSSTITTWEKEKVGFWDDAVKGSSALRAAALRRMRAEAASIMGDEFAFILWDAEKFYDNVDLSQLFDCAISCGLDGREAILGLSIFMAPRSIRIGKVIGDANDPSNGMIAGIKRANFYSRLLLYNVMEKMHEAIPSAGPRTFVDDLAQVITGKEDIVIDLGVRSAKLLISMLKGIKIVISSKSAVIGSRLRIAEAIEKRLREECGTTLKATKHSIDLGIDCGGAARGVTHQVCREAKATTRNSRTKCLVSLCKRAETMVSTGSDPQRSYGFCVMGLPPARLDQWRSSNADARGIATSACNTSAFALRGQHTDPAVTVPMEQIKFWVNLYRSAPRDLQELVQAAWFRIPERVKDVGWRKVTGPCAASFLTLAQIGWKPVGPDVFKNPAGEVWCLGARDYGAESSEDGALGSTRAFEKSLLESAYGQLWAHAANHYCGRGLTFGGDLHAARKLRAQLIEQERFNEAGILDSMVDGSLWFADRFSATTSDSDSICQRCGALIECAHHAIWLCSDNCNLPTEVKTKTDRYIGRTDPEITCLWTRGIVPAELTSFSVSGNGPWRELWMHGDLTLFSRAHTNKHIKLASDGGGGNYGHDPRRARVGWAAVAIRFASCHPDDHRVMEIAALWGGLYEGQTVPRAEVAGLVNLLILAGPGSGFDVGIDNSGVIAQLRCPVLANKCSANDLWAMAQELPQLKTVTGIKVKSHATESDYDRGLCLSWAIANEIADSFAGEAAEKLALSKADCKTVDYWDYRATASLQRGIAVVRRCIEVDELSAKSRPTFNNAPRGTAKTHKEAIIRARTEESSHCMDYTKRRGGIRCSLCLKGPEGRSKDCLAKFLLSTCGARYTETTPATTTTTDDSTVTCHTITVPTIPTGPSIPTPTMEDDYSELYLDLGSDFEFCAAPTCPTAPSNAIITDAQRDQIQLKREAAMSKRLDSLLKRPIEQLTEGERDWINARKAPKTEAALTTEPTNPSGTGQTLLEPVQTVSRCERLANARQRLNVLISTATDQAASASMSCGSGAKAIGCHVEDWELDYTVAAVPQASSNDDQDQKDLKRTYEQISIAREEVAASKRRPTKPSTTFSALTTTCPVGGDPTMPMGENVASGSISSICIPDSIPCPIGGDPNDGAYLISLFLGDVSTYAPPPSETGGLIAQGNNCPFVGLDVASHKAPRMESLSAEAADKAVGADDVNARSCLTMAAAGADNDSDDKHSGDFTADLFGDIGFLEFGAPGNPDSNSIETPKSIVNPDSKWGKGPSDKCTDYGDTPGTGFGGHPTLCKLDGLIVHGSGQNGEQSLGTTAPVHGSEQHGDYTDRNFTAIDDGGGAAGFKKSEKSRPENSITAQEYVLTTAQDDFGGHPTLCGDHRSKFETAEDANISKSDDTAMEAPQDDDFEAAAFGSTFIVYPMSSDESEGMVNVHAELSDESEDLNVIPVQSPVRVRFTRKSKGCTYCNGPCLGGCVHPETAAASTATPDEVESIADRFMTIARGLKREQPEAPRASVAETVPARPPPKRRRTRNDVTLLPLNYGQLPDWLALEPTIGNVRIHPSHIPHLSWHRGITWCRRCGNYATVVPYLLRKLCPGGAALAGERNLSRLARGLPPPNQPAWPEDLPITA